MPPPVATELVTYSSPRLHSFLSCWMEAVGGILKADPTTDYHVNILRPSGNDCALANASLPDSEYRARLLEKVDVLHSLLERLLKGGVHEHIIFTDVDVLLLQPLSRLWAHLPQEADIGFMAEPRNSRSGPLNTGVMAIRRLTPSVVHFFAVWLRRLRANKRGAVFVHPTMQG